MRDAVGTIAAEMKSRLDRAEARQLELAAELRRTEHRNGRK